MKTICLDFGNTRKKCAIFNNEELSEVIVLGEQVIDELMNILSTHRPDYSILSSVINHDVEIEKILKQNTSFHKLNHESKLPIRIPVGRPETIGADRLALCSAITQMFPKSHKLVIGLGTCITYNFINKQNEFLGGSISPGMQMRFKSMNDYTALLPIIEAEHLFPLVGYDTKTNLLSGVLYGLAKEIDGIINLYKEKYNNLQVAMTGGDAAFFVQHIDNQIHFEPELLFKGLLAINLSNR